VSAIDRSIAEILGLDLSSKPEISSGVGGNVKTIRSRIKISFSKASKKILL